MVIQRLNTDYIDSARLCVLKNDPLTRISEQSHQGYSRAISRLYQSYGLKHAMIALV